MARRRGVTVRAATEKRRVSSSTFNVMQRWRDYSSLVLTAFRTTPTPDEMRSRIAASNINQQTLLATDYLNHFNELAMLLEMLADMPEVIDDVRAWAPKGYKEHFRESAFSDRELAVDAYDCVPSAYLVAFEDTVAHIDRLIDGSLTELELSIATGERDVMTAATLAICRQVEELLSRLRSIVNGEIDTLGQGQIDCLLTGSERRGDTSPTADNEAAQGPAMGQDAIDALFD